MIEFIRRHNLLITSGVLLAVALQLMSISVRHRTLPQFGGRILETILSPVEKVSHEIGETTSYLWRHYVWLVSVETERTALRERVRFLEAETARLSELESENKRLRALLNFREATQLEGIAASVIGRDPSNWVRSMTIDRGSTHGLRTGLPVVDGHAIVGQTTVITPKSAKVLLLTDNTSAIAAIVQGSRAQGIAEGTLRKTLNLRYVLKEYPVQVGERVIASGVDGVFPKGVLIGVVSKVEPNTPGMFQQVEVQPSVDLDRIENVLVVIPRNASESGDSNDERVSTEPKRGLSTGESQ